MGLISNLYVKQFVCRYDKEVGIPYYSYLDFKGLKQEAYIFNNSLGIEVHYFYYYYDNYKEDKVILFLHGIGPGHTAYLAEIELLAKHGYKVLTLDYVGCGESKGKCLRSLNEPTRDVLDLLDYLKLNKQIILVGHSLGAYTSLNVINKRKDINKAVILSAFLNISSLASHIIKNKFVISRILKYEKKAEPDLYQIDNIAYLKETNDKILWIHSLDDGVIPYDISLKVVEELANPCIEIIKVNNRKHNPNYTDAAISYMNEVFGKYNYLKKNKKIKTDEDKINYFKDVSLAKLVEQDQEIFDRIYQFID